jgi:integrase/recombinase XerD
MMPPIHNIIRSVQPIAVPSVEPHAIRRIFNNDQLIERFDKWLMICGRSPNTRLSYTLAARQFARSLVNKPVTAATKENVRDFIGTLYAKGFASSTMQLKLDVLRVFFDFLHLGGRIHDCVPRRILRRKLPKRLPHAKSEEEIVRVINAAETPRDRAILEMLYATGLRVSELAHLRLEDLRLQDGSLTVRMGKGGKDRPAFFGRAAEKALRAYIGERSAGFVFAPGRVPRGGVWRDKYGTWFGQWRETDAYGKRVMRTVKLGDYEIPTKEKAQLALKTYLQREISPDRTPAEKPLSIHTMWRIVVDAAKRAGIADMHPHVFRHSMATHILNSGADIRFVQEFLGHTSLVATQKYLHVATAQLQLTHAKFHPRG